MAKQQKKLGEILIEWGIISTREVAKALEHAKSKGLRIGEALVDLKLCNETNVYKALAQQHNMEYIDLDKGAVPPNAVSLVSDDLMRKYLILPLGMENGKLRLAIHDPLDFEMLEVLRFRLNKDIRTVLAPKGRIKAVLDEMFSTSATNTIDKTMDRTIDRLARFAGQVDGPLHGQIAGPLDRQFRGRGQRQRGRRQERSDPGADHQAGAGDDQRGRPQPGQRHPHRTHEGPGAGALSHRRRMRRTRPHSSAHEGAAHQPIENHGRHRHRGKAPAPGRANQAHHRQGQRGLPRQHPAGVSRRIGGAAYSAPDSVRIGIQSLGFEEEDYKVFQKIIKRPNGIFLVTGPTGSGKTTTLYAALNELNRPDKKIITAEDPVEYNFVGINQCQVRENIGLSFSEILRAMLRQAPNIILVGEIRDQEVAEVAIQAALTGHLVFSTFTPMTPPAPSRA